MKVSRAYRVELDPNNVQRTAMVRTAGCSRGAYNWGLQRKQEVWWMNQLPVPSIKTPTAIDLHRELNVRKQVDLGWMYEASKCAPQEALRDLDRAYKNFFDGRAKFPRFHSRHRGPGSFRLTGSVGVEEAHVSLPRIGRVKLKERGYLPRRVHVRSATVSERAGRWVVSFSVEEDRPTHILPWGEVIGVDLGINALATVSDGTMFANPRALKTRQRKLAHLQKEVSRKEKGSKNREKAKSRLSRCHVQVADVRKDALNKITTMLARTKPVIVVETLRPVNLLKNHHLARSLSDASFGEFVRQLEYKCGWYGSRLVQADPFYPSTKRCSSCGNVKKDMPLSERTYSCAACGLVMDRDLNAACNLASVAASSAETINACGEMASKSRKVLAPPQGIRNLSASVGLLTYA
ncbi:MAG: RNA-guided endonuclease InsQ/TnpB family protein [Thermoplasmata archaeon]